MLEPVLPAATAVIDTLELSPNPMGGWFRSVLEEPDPAGGRPIMSVINYLIDAARPVAYFHRMSADAMHYFHQGGPLEVITISPGGRLARTILGADLDAGQQLQVLVPGGCWKAFELQSGPWALISEAVSPGWVPDDQEEATSALFENDFPHLRVEIERLVPS